jgi:transcriptional regulator with XRE-family HTH domain
MSHPVDVHVGKKIRTRRWMVGMTQQQVAESVGIKFQQVQKYETGANRVSASRLYDIAQVLDTPVAYFFEDIEADETGAEATEQSVTAAAGVGVEQFTDKEALDFLRYYYQLGTEPRRRLYELTRSLVDAA